MPLSIEQINKPADFFQSCEPRTCLQHGNLRLKNIMYNEKGKITAIIHWQECISSIGLLWDIFIALHDLPIDGQHQYLLGYGMGE